MSATLAARLAAVAFIGLLAFVPARAQEPFDVDMYRQSVVRIHAITERTNEGYRYKSGTGFIINDQRMIATNRHVVEGAIEFEVFLPTAEGARKLSAHLYLAMPSGGADLAILQTEDELLGEPLVLATYMPPAGMGSIYAVGYPGAADETLFGANSDLNESMFIASITKGTVSRVVPNVEAHGGATIVQHDAAINHGNSGGPLFDECGRVIGINTFGPSDDAGTQGIFFSIHSGELAGLLKRRFVDTSTADAACRPGKMAAPALITATTDADFVLAVAALTNCARAWPCEEHICNEHFQNRLAPGLLPEATAMTEKMLGRYAAVCTEQTSALAFLDLLSCARERPCAYEKACAGPYRETADPAAQQNRAEDLGTIADQAMADCQASRTTAAQPPATQPAQVVTPSPGPAPAPAPAPATGGTGRVPPPRDYHAELRYTASTKIEQQAPFGNCLNQRLRITVTPDLAVGWEMVEGTRKSQWVGRIDPGTGAISIERQNVSVLDVSTGNTFTPDIASVSGPFDNPSIEFGPCGSGKILVRG